MKKYKGNHQFASVKAGKSNGEPRIGDFVIEPGADYGDRWFKIGRIRDEGYDAAHTKAYVIETFTELEFVGVTQRNGSICWTGKKVIS